jgi:holo-[acyl-carrier protein] synthase
MALKIGCDVVYIPKFARSIKDSGDKLLNKIFTSFELSRAKNTETLAGMFAAKEAIIKALELKAGDWHRIEIVKNEKERPRAKLAGAPVKIVSQDISISHDGKYAMAAAIFLAK